MFWKKRYTKRKMPLRTGVIRKKIFNPFFSTRGGETGGEEGSGLGLFISKNIVDDMKGELRVESAPGKGAKFAVVLPVHSQNEKEAQKI